MQIQYQRELTKTRSRYKSSFKDYLLFIKDKGSVHGPLSLNKLLDFQIL